MHNNNKIRKRNPKFVIATTAVITAVMLLGTTAISTLTTAESVFAYRNNQAASQANDCGNGSVPIDTVLCQNTGSQIQGDKNTVALSSQQTFPADPCVACFNSISVEQRADFEERIPGIAEAFGGQASTIEELCALLEILNPGQQVGVLDLVRDDLLFVGVDRPTTLDIVQCLIDVLGLPPPPPPPPPP
jgi:hypothetical protein